MQFPILSFEGPDPYARAGGLASRVEGLAHALAGLGFETHLWFVGELQAAGREQFGKREHLIPHLGAGGGAVVLRRSGIPRTRCFTSMLSLNARRCATGHPTLERQQHLRV